MTTGVIPISTPRATDPPTPSPVVSPEALALARQVERLAGVQQVVDGLRALETRASVLGIRVEQATAEAAIADQRRGEFRAALQPVYRDPALAERAFAEAVRQHGAERATAALRTTPETYGALTTIDTPHLRGLVTSRDETTARAAAPVAAHAASQSLLADGRVEQLVHTLYERTIAERGPTIPILPDVAPRPPAPMVSPVREPAVAPGAPTALAASTVPERLAVLETAQRGAVADVLVRRQELAMSGQFLAGDPAKEAAALSKQIGQGLAKLPAEQVAQLRNLLTAAGERALGTVTSLGLHQVKDLALGAER